MSAEVISQTTPLTTNEAPTVVTMAYDDLIEMAVSNKSEFLNIVGQMDKSDIKQLYNSMIKSLLMDKKKIEIIKRETHSVLKGAGSHEVSLSRNKQTGDVDTIIVTKDTIRELDRAYEEKLKLIPAVSMMSVKTRRISTFKDDDSGFNNPCKQKDEIINFLAKANFGPVIKGNLTKNKEGKGKAKNNMDTMEVVPGSNLGDTLWFYKSNVYDCPNELKGFASHCTLTTLFSLNIYHNQSQNPDNLEIFLATKDMRECLSNLMRELIEKDYSKICANNPDMVDEAKRCRDLCIKAITDSSVKVDMPAEFDMFNPNGFKYSKLSSLIALGKDEQPNPETYQTIVRSMYQKLRHHKVLGQYFDSELNTYGSEEELAAKTAHVLERVQRIEISKASCYKESLKNKQKEAIRAAKLAAKGDTPKPARGKKAKPVETN